MYIHTYIYIHVYIYIYVHMYIYKTLCIHTVWRYECICVRLIQSSGVAAWLIVAQQPPRLRQVIVLLPLLPFLGAWAKGWQQRYGQMLDSHIWAWRLVDSLYPLLKSKLLLAKWLFALLLKYNCDSLSHLTIAAKFPFCPFLLLVHSLWSRLTLSHLWIPNPSRSRL